MGRDFLNTPEVRDDDTNKAVPSGQSEVDEKAELEKELSLLEEKLSARDAIMEPGVQNFPKSFRTMSTTIVNSASSFLHVHSSFLLCQDSLLERVPLIGVLDITEFSR